MKNLLFNKTSYFFIFLMVNVSLWGQTEDLNPCGTPIGKSVWLSKYQQSPDLYEKGGGNLLYIPLSIHILGTDEGDSYFGVNQLLDAMCTLNTDFLSANMIFYIEGEINYINNSSWHRHESTIIGGEMMLQNDIPNTLNCYFVADPAGNCGYNLPYASVAMANSCAGPNSHTWAHEIGHALTLPHTFLGWEGGISYNDSIPPNFSNPAPERVTYDYTLFKDTLILDTLIIDTAWVELVDRSNCLIAADGFCDTPADYIAQRWNCNANGESEFTQKDPDGVSFRSAGSFIMSYSGDACQSQFSEDQIAAMRANLFDEHSDWLGNENPQDMIAELPTLLAPIEGQDAQFNQVYLEWDPAPNATAYVVLVSRIVNFAPALTEMYVTDESQVLVENLSNNKTYYWKVRPYSPYYFCANFSVHETFHTANIVATQNVHWQGSINVYPTVVNNQMPLYLTMERSSMKDFHYEIINAVGRVLDHGVLPAKKTNPIALPAHLTAGVYFLVVKSGRNNATFRFVVM